MADITPDPWTWSSTPGSNQPSGTTPIATGLDDNLRAIEAGVKAALEPLSSVSGTNTITGTCANLTAYATGQVFRFIPANTNTGATTLNITSIGAKNVFNQNAACIGGEIKAGAPVQVMYDGTQFQIIGWRLARTPTRQVFTSGSDDYTTPAGVTSINVRLVGGGGGGGGATANNGTGGNNTTFGTLTGTGGGAGGASGAGGTGGGASGGDINIPGGDGGPGATALGTTQPGGGNGGNSAFGGGGKGGITSAAGGNGSANSGGGGGGGGQSSSSCGGGGGSGGYVEKLITAPSATYAYAVGGAANGGSAGGQAGGNGAAGIIIVDEFYD